jgi:hypothetical protein
MPKNLSPSVATMTLIVLLLAGCGKSGDSRYQRLAHQALAEQAEQNKRLAEQSRQIAEASRRLVEGDAEARKDLLEAQKQLTSELHSERVSLDRQREEMEEERRNIAAQRQRDPIIAEAITAFGLTLTCLLPLALAAYIVWAATRHSDEGDALGELLVMEIAAEKPLLLPPPAQPVPALEHTPSPKHSP